MRVVSWHVQLQKKWREIKGLELFRGVKSHNLNKRATAGNQLISRFDSGYNRRVSVYAKAL